MTGYKAIHQDTVPFAEAIAEKNMARLRLVVDDLNHMKTECHARCK